VVNTIRIKLIVYETGFHDTERLPPVALYFADRFLLAAPVLYEINLMSIFFTTRWR
jgi:hypothetical protein